MPLAKRLVLGDFKTPMPSNLFSPAAGSIFTAEGRALRPPSPHTSPSLSLRKRQMLPAASTINQQFLAGVTLRPTFLSSCLWVRTGTVISTPSMLNQRGRIYFWFSCWPLTIRGNWARADLTFIRCPGGAVLLYFLRTATRLIADLRFHRYLTIRRHLCVVWLSCLACCRYCV